MNREPKIVCSVVFCVDFRRPKQRFVSGFGIKRAMTPGTTAPLICLQSRASYSLANLDGHDKSLAHRPLLVQLRVVHRLPIRNLHHSRSEKSVTLHELMNSQTNGESRSRHANDLEHSGVPQLLGDTHVVELGRDELVVRLDAPI